MSPLPRTLSQGDLNTFADISGDHNPIHTDPAYAATTSFALPVAHGMNLFSFALAALQRRHEGAEVSEFSLMFPNPTPVGTRIDVWLDGDGEGPLQVEVRHEDGEAGLRGELTLASAPPPSPAAAAATGAAGPGEAHTEARTFTAEAARALAALTGENAPAGQVPLGLIAGAISKILGVDLPGRGTNYLKQRLALHAPAPLGEDLTFEVRVRKVVAHKRLVYLITTCRGTAGDLIATGEALVLAHGRLPESPPTTPAGGPK